MRRSSVIPIEKICLLLESTYGRPGFEPGCGVLDELILTILSQSTTAANYNRAFASLKARFSDWDAVRSAETSSLEEAIRCGGLAHTKAIRIKRLLDDIFELHGELSLNFPDEMTDEDARAYLMQFEGVGIKTASCVLMFALNRPVFPVDTHVHRIAQRLGLIDSSVKAEAAHAVLQGMIPDEMVYSMHVNLVAHGRRVCKAQRPVCDDCVLLELCRWGVREAVSR